MVPPKSSAFWNHHTGAESGKQRTLPLQDMPDADVRARKASSEERTQLWPRVVDLYSGYADHQGVHVA